MQSERAYGTYVKHAKEFFVLRQKAAGAQAQGVPDEKSTINFQDIVNRCEESLTLSIFKSLSAQRCVYVCVKFTLAMIHIQSYTHNTLRRNRSSPRGSQATRRINSLAPSEFHRCAEAKSPRRLSCLQAQIEMSILSAL